jgi:phospholipase/lecithinase/hemolysin
VSFAQQIEQFVAYGNPALESISLSKKEALIAVWIGINDVNDLKKLRGVEEDYNPLYERVQRNVWKSVEKVYGLGYRKFLVMNLPPLDRSPSPGVNASLVNAFNNIASEHADNFARRHWDATVLQYDVNSVLNGILDVHDAYGFSNVTGFCPGYNKADVRSDPEKYGCGEGLDTYFWYDSGHLGSRTNEVFAGMLEGWLGRRSWT